ncbi:unnamed protein product [Arabidopsis thaliana]|jgi:hypothetical protein|uniref:At5g49710 n=2 Tax=Arabidopsis thaliana TaxID=3702 RepID=A1A6K7_ARATH|nr:RING finger protein [Arabidopsis thaliana]ABL66783.1 At5g49710 [Arabidopsis thaliana]AED95847.1 RING finger protein [Arabidopsis thaliana]CAD5334449.1 unnamed protein product [Arabidopsis thaliana]|eukprot:NP_199782.3 RING finger protein [Arabidopsis thaliana]
MDNNSERKGKRIDKDNIRVKRKTLQALLNDCQRALELLNLAEVSSEDDEDDKSTGEGSGSQESRGEVSSSDREDPEADELYDLIKSRVECDDFLEKIESAQVSAPQHLADSSSWDVVSEDDLWDDETMAQREEDYVLVREEDIAEGIACFMATYLQSLKQTKDLTPEQLQKALSRMFSVKNRKGKLRKAWDGSKVAYNVASWSATVIGIYQNPVILRVASKAFWASCHVISKLV